MNTMAEIIRVMVVDDNDLMRRGLVATLSIEPDLKVVGAAANAREALEMYRELQPDAVTMDYQMPGMNGIECTKRLLEEFPDVQVILFSILDSEEDIWSAVRAGVRGYLTKRTGEVGVVLKAIREVAKGNDFYPENLAKKLEHRKKQPELTSREFQVLHLLVKGCSNKAMANELGLSLPTIKFHVLNLRLKLGAVDRTQAVVNAYERGILRTNDSTE